eukprot:ANDGO_08153.mRNA.1 Tetratricopeptide repeat protein 4 homolog
MSSLEESASKNAQLGQQRKENEKENEKEKEKKKQGEEEEEDWEVKGPPVYDRPEIPMSHAIFQTRLTDSMLQNDETIAAMQSLIYDETTPDERARNWKNTANEMLGLKTEAGARNAIGYYTQALQEELTDMELKSQLLNNRSQANLQIKNYGHAIEDARAVLALRSYAGESAVVKACFRGAKGASAVSRYDDTIDFCDCALKILRPMLSGERALKMAEKDRKREEELKSQFEQMLKESAAKRTEVERKREKDEKERKKRNKLWGELKRRLIRIGPMEIPEGTVQGGEFRLDYDVSDTGELSLPCVVLYDQLGQSDFINRVSEFHPLSAQLEQLFPVPWDPSLSLQSVKCFYLSRFGQYVPFSHSALTFGELWRKDDYFLHEGMCVIHVVMNETDEQKAFVKQWMRSSPGSSWEAKFDQFQYEELGK